MKEPPWIAVLLDRPYTPTASRLVDWYLVRMDEGKYHRRRRRTPRRKIRG